MSGGGTCVRKGESPKKNNTLGKPGLEGPFRMKYLLTHF